MVLEDMPLRGDAVEQQHDRIRAEIVDGALPPGSLLLETALSQRYGVSRTPVREALARLAQEGLLERSTRGYRVRVRTVADVSDIFEARISLESTAAALAAERRSDLDLAALQRLQELRRQEQDSGAQEALNVRFHQEVIRAAGNETIRAMLDTTRTLLAIYRPAFSERRIVEDVEKRELADHERMIEAIEGRNASLAHDLMAAHLQHGRELRIRALLEES